MATSDETIQAWHQRINDGLLRTGQITRVEHGKRMSVFSSDPPAPPPTKKELARLKRLELAVEANRKRFARQRELVRQVGPALRQARIELGMTRAQVGHVIDRSADTIRAIECAERGTDLDNVRELCLELGVEFPEEYSD